MMACSDLIALSALSRWQTHLPCTNAWCTKPLGITTAINSFCGVTCARLSYAVLGAYYDGVDNPICLNTDLLLSVLCFNTVCIHAWASMQLNRLEDTVMKDLL